MWLNIKKLKIAVLRWRGKLDLEGASLGISCSPSPLTLLIRCHHYYSQFYFSISLGIRCYASIPRPGLPLHKILGCKELNIFWPDFLSVNHSLILLNKYSLYNEALCFDKNDLTCSYKLRSIFSSNYLNISLAVIISVFFLTFIRLKSFAFSFCPRFQRRIWNKIVLILKKIPS